MKRPSTGKLSRGTNVTRSPGTMGKIDTVARLSRFSSVIEPLESRTLMSVAHAPVPPPVKAGKSTKSPAPTLVVPSSVTIAATSPTSIRVGWTEGTSTATGYKVLRSKSGGSFSQVSEITSAATLTYIDNTVTSNTSYSYKIEAYNSAATTAASPVVSVMTPLLAPSTLTATAQSGNKIVLAWKDNDSSAASYEIYRESDGVHFVQLASVTGATANTYTDNTVTHGKSYSYQVQACKLTNTSAMSAGAIAVTPLAAPSGLSATLASDSWIHLGWTGNDSAATGYIVLRSNDGIHFNAISTLSTATANSMDDRTVSPFTTYYYEVEATTTATASSPSSSASATTPLAVPTGTTATAISPTSVKITWTDTDAAAGGYVILRSTGNSVFTQIGVNNSGSNTSWTDNTVSPNTTYSYEVKSTNGTSASLVTTPVSVTTPMSAPTSLSATANSASSITLNWTDTDPTATQYAILRSVNGSAFATLATVTSGIATSYTDNTVVSGHSYNYDILSEAGNRSSGMSSIVTAITPIGAPSGLTANAASGTSVVLNWNDNDPDATGYNILRSSDGVTFHQISTVNGTGVVTCTDNTVSSAGTYYYRVQSYDAYATSTASNTANVTTPLLAPTGLAASVVGSYINLSWTDRDASASGYIIRRSTDGINFTQLTQLNSATVDSYTDTSVSAGQKYYYQVQAITTALTSAVSNTASATAATSAPVQTTVTITTRYTNELVITAAGTNDTVSVYQSGPTLTIIANGQATTQTVPAAGVFIYTRGGTDNIYVDSTVTVRTTVETIDTGVDDIDTLGTNVSVWDDSSDIHTGDGTVHTITSFAGGVSKATGASVANPSDSGNTMHVTGSLWGTGPVAADVNQGDSGDCYFLSTLAAFAGVQPRLLQQSAVDMGDGTYTVQFITSAGTPEYVRVSNSVPTYGGGYYVYAHPGNNGDLWAVIMEKAFAYFRTGANTYSSISSGWMGEVYSDLGVNSTFFDLSSMNATTLYNTLTADLAAGEEVTLGTGSNPLNLVGDHAYTLIGVSINPNGTVSYEVRNPWGISGDALENNQGYANLSFAQMESNFVDCCEAV